MVNYDELLGMRGALNQFKFLRAKDVLKIIFFLLEVFSEMQKRFKTETQSLHCCS